MRLWSLHPKYLDPRGLVALWREALLAQRVLQRATRGYRHHPQLRRFREHPAPLQAVGAYLVAVWREARQRDYRFDFDRIEWPASAKTIPVTAGQMRYEARWLAVKLDKRRAVGRTALAAHGTPEAHPLFRVVPGRIAVWERPR